MVVSTPPRSHPGTRFPLYPKVECLPQLWLPQIQCCTVAWSEENWRVCSAWAGIYSEVVLGNPAATRADLSLHCLGESHCAYSSQVQVSHSPSIYPSSPPTIQGGLSPLHMTPGQGCPIYGLTTHSPGQVSTCVISFFLWVPPQGHRSQPYIFLSLPTWFHVYLSYSFGCTGILLPLFS